MHQPRQQIVDWAGFGNFERRIPPGGPFSPLSSHLRFKCRHSPSVFIRVHPWFEHPRFRSCPPQPQRRRTFPSIRGRADKKFIQNPPPGPVFFISGFFQAAYKYFNNFGPWTADVQGPRLNSCVMTVVMTTLAGRSVANRRAAARIFDTVGWAAVIWLLASDFCLLKPNLEVSRTFPPPMPHKSSKLI